jgi:NAD(P)-dependent dehydrogenase (short-subunit alcohol dehydrogenase family)
MNLTHTMALISGGASGLGAVTARRLVAGGAKVLILDQDGARASSLADELGASARAAAADVTDAGSVQAAIDLMLAELGGLNAVINTAGIGMALRTTSKNGPHPLDVFEEVLRINLVGAFNVLRLCATVMVNNAPNEHGERGVILNAVHSAAFDGQAGQAAYAASKGGLAALTLPVARDLAEDGIRVLALVPPLSDAAPSARHGRADEFAQMVIHALETPGLTGETLRGSPSAQA